MPETQAPGAITPLKRVTTHDRAMVERLCERVYRNRLGADGPRMEAKDGVEKLRSRAMAYESTVRATLDALTDEPLGASLGALLDAGQKMLGAQVAA